MVAKKLRVYDINKISLSVHLHGTIRFSFLLF